MSNQTQGIELMRDGLYNIRQKLPADHCTAHAGLLLQRGLTHFDDAKDKHSKQDVIERVSNIKASSLYQKAYERWKNHTLDSSRFECLIAQVKGRLYTGMSSATALETGLTTHHTYGMPMLSGSSVKGVVSAYAAQLGLSEAVCNILFGDEKIAGAVIWHDAWWVPDDNYRTQQPFVGEIITTHHQAYYTGEKKIADELEDPIPNQQIACRGSFYFVVECDNASWAEFARNLLLAALQENGMGSKTASGYGYFEKNEKMQQELEEHGKKREQEKAEKREQEEKNKAFNALPKHEQCVDKWQNILCNGKKYTTGDAEGGELFKQLLADLNDAITQFDAEQQKYIATELSLKKLESYQSNWLSDKRKKEIKPILAKLRGE